MERHAASPLLYSSLTGWYDLIDPVADHADEAAAYQEALLGAVVGDATTLLELGAGAGNDAWHLNARFRCTLNDVSPDMLALSFDRVFICSRPVA